MRPTAKIKRQKEKCTSGTMDSIVRCQSSLKGLVVGPAIGKLWGRVISTNLLATMIVNEMS